MIKIGNLLVVALAIYSTSAFSNENIAKGIRSISGTISYDRYKNSCFARSQKSNEEMGP